MTEEDSGRLVYQAEFFTEPEAPMTEYAVDFLVDMRALFYAEAIRSAFDWCVSELGDDPKRPVAAAAFDPLYSFWYSYHQNVSAESVERECSEVAKFGLKTVIVDDGWQTDDSSGGYSFCGDWRVSAKKFPDFAAHVANVRKTGLKYMLWYAVRSSVRTARTSRGSGASASSTTADSPRPCSIRASRRCAGILPAFTSGR